MKYKQAIVGGAVAVVVAGSVQRWLGSGEITVDPTHVRVGRIEIRATSSSTAELLPISVGPGLVDNKRLFKYSISSKDGRTYEMIYATDHDPLIRILAKGYDIESVSLSSLESRSGITVFRESQNEN